MTDPTRAPIVPENGALHYAPCFVVGFDFSLTAEDALDQTLAFCSLIPGCRLHVGWAPMADLEREDLDPKRPATAAARLNDYMQQRLEGYRRAGIELRELDTQLHLLAGPPAPAITRLAHQVEADTVVVGHDESKGMDDGSVAAAVIRAAQCPVLVARPRLESPDEALSSSACVSSGDKMAPKLAERGDVRQGEEVASKASPARREREASFRLQTL